MSEMQEVETFDPHWDVADRLQKATTQGYVMESPIRLRQAAATAWVA